MTKAVLCILLIFALGLSVSSEPARPDSRELVLQEAEAAMKPVMAHYGTLVMAAKIPLC